MNREGRGSGGVEMADDFIGAAFGAREHKSPCEVFAAHDGDQRGRLCPRFNVNNAFVDFKPFLGGNLRPHRIAQEGVGEARNRRRHRRGKEDALAVRRNEADDRADCVDKSEIEHLVDFIKDESLDLGKAERTLIDKVKQAARRRDENVEPVARHRFLTRHRGAADNERRSQAQAAPVGAEALMHLRGELSGRGDDENSAVAPLSGARRLRQPM